MTYRKATNMTRKIFGAFALVLALVTGFAATRVAHAQTAGGMGGMMGMMSMMKDCPMASAMAQCPSAVLGHREELGLTDAQVKQLSALQDGAQKARAQAMEQMRAVHQAIARASEGERFDEAAVRSAFDRMGTLHTEMGMAMLRTRHQVRQLLTPEQRQKLDGMESGMMGMGGMMNGKGGMEDCPMMRGGMKGGMKGMHMQGSGDATGHTPQS